MEDVIRVLLVDDHQVVSQGLAALLAEAPGIAVVGQATNIAAAESAIEQTHPDVVVTDVMMNGEAAGIELLRHLVRRPGAPKVIILSSFEGPSLYQAALAAGASGYLSKSAAAEEVVNALHTVASGGTVYPLRALQDAAEAPRMPSDRELDIIARVASGQANSEIAGALTISEKTVESHLRRLFVRYRVMSRTELAMLAVREGWIADN